MKQMIECFKATGTPAASASFVDCQNAAAGVLRSKPQITCQQQIPTL
jgi:hypothetical protein